MAKTSQKEPKRSDFVIDLNKVPGGNRKPHELCDFLEKMRDWRAKSLNSTVMINARR
jgi:hypothetical protein